MKKVKITPAFTSDNPGVRKPEPTIRQRNNHLRWTAGILIFLAVALTVLGPFSGPPPMSISMVGISILLLTITALRRPFEEPRREPAQTDGAGQ